MMVFGSVNIAGTVMQSIRAGSCSTVIITAICLVPRGGVDNTARWKGFENARNEQVRIHSHRYQLRPRPTKHEGRGFDRTVKDYGAETSNQTPSMCF